MQRYQWPQPKRTFHSWRFLLAKEGLFESLKSYEKNLTVDNIFSIASFGFSHLQSYPCPLNMNFLWNLGFLVALTMILQILTGILLGLHYTPHINSAYSSLMHILPLVRLKREQKKSIDNRIS